MVIEIRCLCRVSRESEKWSEGVESNDGFLLSCQHATSTLIYISELESAKRKDSEVEQVKERTPLGGTLAPTSAGSASSASKMNLSFRNQPVHRPAASIR